MPFGFRGLPDTESGLLASSYVHSITSETSRNFLFFNFKRLILNNVPKHLFFCRTPLAWHKCDPTPPCVVGDGHKRDGYKSRETQGVINLCPHLFWGGGGHGRGLGVGKRRYRNKFYSRRCHPRTLSYLQVCVSVGRTVSGCMVLCMIAFYFGSSFPL